MTAIPDWVSMIRETLTAALHPAHLVIEDESHKHIGHAGARQGGGHFGVNIVCASFTGKGLLERQRMMYQSLGIAMQRDIHALSIKAYSPEEFNTNEG